MDKAALEAKLSEFDFIVCVDASGSMGESDKQGEPSRWNKMQETATAFARDLAAMDSDGIDLVVFGGSAIDSHKGVTPDKIKNIFGERRPMGGTPLADALTAAFKLAGQSDKKRFVMVFTDGLPDDKNAVVNVITKQANQQKTDDELTILFVQVGRDPAATEYLRKLDDSLNTKFDIVDAKTIDEAEQFASTAELVFEAIND